MALAAFQWDCTIQCCRVFTLALARLPCNVSYFHVSHHFQSPHRTSGIALTSRHRLHDWAPLWGWHTLPITAIPSSTVLFLVSLVVIWLRAIDYVDMKVSFSTPVNIVWYYIVSQNSKYRPTRGSWIWHWYLTASLWSLKLRFPQPSWAEPSRGGRCLKAYCRPAVVAFDSRHLTCVMGRQRGPRIAKKNNNIRNKMFDLVVFYRRLGVHTTRH